MIWNMEVWWISKKFEISKEVNTFWQQYEQMDEVANLKKSSQWLEKTYLKDTTDPVITVAQEQHHIHRGRSLPQLTSILENNHYTLSMSVLIS